MKAFLRWFKAWRNGRYPIPWKTIALAAVTLVYVVSPVDFLPEYIPFLGVVDDIVLLGLFIRSVRNEVSRFAEWEKKTAVMSNR